MKIDMHLGCCYSRGLSGVNADNNKPISEGCMYKVLDRTHHIESGMSIQVLSQASCALLKRDLNK